jgi:hypothetical protein
MYVVAFKFCVTIETKCIRYTTVTVKVNCKHPECWYHGKKCCWRTIQCWADKYSVVTKKQGKSM